MQARDGRFERKSRRDKQKDRSHLASLSDRDFLLNLAGEIRGMNIGGSFGSSVSRKAMEGVNFLQRRSDFWNQIDTSK